MESVVAIKKQAENMAKNTTVHYSEIIDLCRELFIKKMADYGTAWRILRLSSITDQILIKAQRIRSIEEKGSQKIDESIDAEFVGIINYCVIALIQLEMGNESNLEMPVEEVKNHFDFHVIKSKELMENKNHDYGEAWRGMRTSSMTDLILMKLLRIKQIEDNKGNTIVSEGIDANYYDIINYSVFALIKLESE